MMHRPSVTSLHHYAEARAMSRHAGPLHRSRDRLPPSTMGGAEPYWRDPNEPDPLLMALVCAGYAPVSALFTERSK
jgi:hypothetical protein